MDKLQAVIDEMHEIEEKRYKSNRDVARYRELVTEAQRLRNNRDMMARIEARDYNEPSSGNLSQFRIVGEDHFVNEREQELTKKANSRIIGARLPIKVRFVPEGGLKSKWDGKLLSGKTFESNGRYYIVLEDGHTRQEELKTFCHELAHARAGHVEQAITTDEIDEVARFPTLFKDDDDFEEAVEIARDTIKMLGGEQDRREDDADELGRQFFHILFPGESYL